MIAAGTAALSSILGGLAALWLWSRNKRWASGMMLLSLPLAAMPVYIYALAWFTGADLFRRAFEVLGLSTGMRSGIISVIILETLVYTPLAAAFAWWSTRSIPPELVESGHLIHPDLVVLRRVALPLAAPSLGCAGALIFLISLLDYSVPTLLQVQVYPLEIFADFSASSQPERAFMLALPITAVATLVLILLLKPSNKLIYKRWDRTGNALGPVETAISAGKDAMDRYNEVNALHQDMGKIDDELVDIRKEIRQQEFNRDVAQLGMERSRKDVEEWNRLFPHQAQRR